MTITQPRTPAGSPAGGQFGNKPGGAESTIALPATAREHFDAVATRALRPHVCGWDNALTNVERSALIESVYAAAAAGESTFTIPAVHTNIGEPKDVGISGLEGLAIDVQWAEVANAEPILWSSVESIGSFTGPEVEALNARSQRLGLSFPERVEAVSAKAKTAIEGTPAARTLELALTRAAELGDDSLFEDISEGWAWDGISGAVLATVAKGKISADDYSFLAGPWIDTFGPIA